MTSKDSIQSLIDEFIKTWDIQKVYDDLEYDLLKFLLVSPSMSRKFTKRNITILMDSDENICYKLPEGISYTFSGPKILLCTDLEYVEEKITYLQLQDIFRESTLDLLGTTLACFWGAYVQLLEKLFMAGIVKDDSFLGNTIDRRGEILDIRVTDYLDLNIIYKDSSKVTIRGGEYSPYVLWNLLKTWRTENGI